MKNYTGVQLKNRFIKRGKLQKEDVIESVIKDAFTYCSDGSIETCKEPAFRGVTDGVLTMYKTSSRSEVLCKMINESKRNIQRNSIGYKRQVIQCLGYAVQFLMDGNLKFLIFTSERYIDYMSIDENIDIIWKYLGKIRQGIDEYPPSELYKSITNFNLNEFVIYHNNITDDFNMKDIILDIRNKMV